MPGDEKTTGINYTAVAALLILAFIFIPAVLIVSRPFRDVSLLAAIGCSVICVGLARSSWRKSSQLSIPSIAERGRRNQ
jgi:hypothetical protein